MLPSASLVHAQHYTAQDAVKGAQLRSEAGIVVSLLYFPCHQADALAAPLARYEALRARLEQTPHAVDLAIAEADFDYQMSLVDIACPDPEAPETRRQDDLNASIANNVLDRMEILVNSADPNRPEKGQ